MPSAAAPSRCTPCSGTQSPSGSGGGCPGGAGATRFGGSLRGGSPPTPAHPAHIIPPIRSAVLITHEDFMLRAIVTLVVVVRDTRSTRGHFLVRRSGTAILSARNRGAPIQR